MKGRLGPRNPVASMPEPTRVFLNFPLGDSRQTRIKSSGAAMRAICLLAPARASIKSPRFRLRYHRAGQSTRKKAQTASVQLAATKTGKKTKGAGSAPSGEREQD